VNHGGLFDAMPTLSKQMSFKNWYDVVAIINGHMTKKTNEENLSP